MAAIQKRSMDGVIVGSDLTQEWLLPWWWNHYRKHNSYPVAFIDFGLSFTMKDWCQERGVHIPLRIVDFAKEKEEIDPLLVKKWEKRFSDFWGSRNAWLKKPLACLKSPFKRTLWIDLDCEIQGPLTPLFEYADSPVGMAMAKDIPSRHSRDYQIYNSGVIPFRQHLPLIKEWADWCIEQNHLFRGDQEVFSHMIAEKKIALPEVPPLYNWSRVQKQRSDAIILHWHGAYGKYVIQSQIHRATLCSEFD